MFDQEEEEYEEAIQCLNDESAAAERQDRETRRELADVTRLEGQANQINPTDMA